jgi:hypothetical protein
MQLLINKYIYSLFVFSLVFIIVLYNTIGFTYIDELCAMALLAFFIYVLVKTPDWDCNKAFLVTLFVFAFYTAYSMWIGSNSNRAIFNDLVIQLKPFLGFFCVYQLMPLFSEGQKKQLKDIVLVVWFVFLLPLGIIALFYPKIFVIFGHPAYYGIAVTVFSLCYLYCSPFTWRTKIIFLALLSIGIFGGRSKFYGFYAMSVFLLLFFSTKKTFKLNLKNILIMICMCVAMILAAWQKIYIYFFGAIMLDSNIDKDMIARYALYAVSPQVLVDYFPFGSGFASYATHSSGEYYSALYEKYGLDNVWGLSKSYHDFVADTYYPSLAQFGVVGIILFIIFWVYIVRLILRYYIKEKNIPQIITSLLIVGFLAIESTTGSTFTAQGGIFVMMMLGLVLSQMKSQFQVDKNQASQTHQDQL